MAHHELDTAKTVADVAAVATTVGTLAQVLPSLAALFTIIWTGFRIYETDTVQGWLGKKPPPDQS
jgi:hypothetical protein